MEDTGRLTQGSIKETIAKNAAEQSMPQAII